MTPVGHVDGESRALICSGPTCRGGARLPGLPCVTRPFTTQSEVASMWPRLRASDPRRHRSSACFPQVAGRNLLPGCSFHASTPSSSGTYNLVGHGPGRLQLRGLRRTDGSNTRTPLADTPAPPLTSPAVRRLTGPNNSGPAGSWRCSVAFSLDWSDREAVGWVAAPATSIGWTPATSSRSALRLAPADPKLT